MQRFGIYAAGEGLTFLTVHIIADEFVGISMMMEMPSFISNGHLLISDCDCMEDSGNEEKFIFTDNNYGNDCFSMLFDNAYRLFFI